MTFSEAVRSCIQEKYVTFSGRAPRSEYWYFFLFIFIVAIVLGGIGGGLMAVNETLGFIVLGILGLFYLAMLLPMISVAVRRFHDRDLSGWWYLGAIVAGMIPFVGILASIAAFVITVLKGTEGENKFGPDPLAPANADVFS